MRMMELTDRRLGTTNDDGCSVGGPHIGLVRKTQVDSIGENSPRSTITGGVSVSAMSVLYLLCCVNRMPISLATVRKTSERR